MYKLAVDYFKGKQIKPYTGKGGKVYAYYKCANQKKKHICDKKTIAKDKFEDAVVKAMVDRVMNDKIMKNYRIDFMNCKIKKAV
jgi:hypothetical protein